ncbi:fructose-specific PTS transporter subunit EIIC [Pantoea sp. 1.19]|uniref:PTS fructose transporter subunit IIABC n=1 Tax=Pantoea sp. 1.19 TaxID=1925589 RepID=UPI000948D4ED|nr:fructose-specific PTS transporter subunit EIIC [Pantoea sp. 1.19]
MQIDELINERLITLDLQATDKSGVWQELTALLAADGCLHDPAQFLADVAAREALGNTGFDDGIALPHAKSAAVSRPAVALGIHRRGIDYGAEDGQPSRLFFLIASPAEGANQHIELLAALSSRLIEAGFMAQLLAAATPADALTLFSHRPQAIDPANATRGLLIGVTGCPAGIAHTYLAAEALTKGAAELGYRIKVETNGSIGVKDSPSATEIAEADAIIVACDKQVELDRFAGKRLVSTGVKAPIRDARGLIQQALSAPIWRAGGSAGTPTAAKPAARAALYRYLMNGVSHMIPLVVTGGLLIALALALGGVPSPGGMAIPSGSLWQKVLDVGAVAFTLMIPVLAGYIAWAIADRPALAPGLIGGWIANHGEFYGASAGTGFIGAMIAGLLVGYFVRWLTRFPYHKYIQPLVPIMIAPIAGTLFISALFMFVIGSPIASLMDHLTALLTSLSSGNLLLLGVVLGGMTGFDMGGPFNKVAFLFCVGMIASGQTQFMGAMACAIPVAPLGMALATVAGRRWQLFERAELEAGKAAGAMGLVGISEGAIPFAAQDPVAVIPANVLGSMVAAVLAFQLGLTTSVAHGGPVVALLGAINRPLWALACMACGALVTATICLLLKRLRRPAQRPAVG